MNAGYVKRHSKERIKNDTIGLKARFDLCFYQSGSGRQPVREWLHRLDAASRQRLGRDLRQLQLGWPVGMPLVRKLDKNLWELRSRLPVGIARLLFTVHGRKIIALHGLIKKSKKLPLHDLNLALNRLTDFYNRIKT